MELKGKPKHRPATQIEDIIYKRNGKWYNARTDRYLKPAQARRLLSYYRRHPLTVPALFARGEKKKARKIAQQKMEQEGKSTVEIELPSIGGVTKVRYSKRKRDQQTVSEGEIDASTDYGRLVDYVIPKLENNLRNYECIDISEVDDVYELQTKLERYVDIDTTMEGGTGNFAKGWTAKRTNAIAHHLGITMMEVRKRYQTRNYT